MRRHLGFTAALIAAVFPATAHADPVQLSASFTLNALDGKHDTGTAIDRLNFVPLPLAEADAGIHRTALHLEGLPPLTFGYGDGSGGTQATRLSIVTVSLRQWLGGGVFAGVGQTIYNQRTTYPARGPADVESQASRVTGARFEAGFVHRLAGRTHIEYVFAVNPAMRGVERTRLQGTFRSAELANPERAVQIDTGLRYAVRVGRGDLLYGIRYLNYASRYDLRGQPDDGLLADRNVGFMPVVGYRISL